MGMVKEVQRQFRDIPGLMEGTNLPDYERCITISTAASLREMIAPGILVMGSPIAVGVLFGTHALAGMLAGSLVSSVQMAIACSNSGERGTTAKSTLRRGCTAGRN